MEYIGKEEFILLHPKGIVVLHKSAELELTSSVVLVAQSCPTLCNLMDYSLSVSSVQGNTGVDCHSLLQQIFLMQGSNSGLLHCRQTLPIELQGRSRAYQVNRNGAS